MSHRFPLFGRIILAAALVLPAALAAQPARPTPQTAAHSRLAAADSTTTFLVRLRDGSSLAGRVQALHGDSLVFASTIGTVPLRLADVMAASEVRPEDFRNGEYWFPNPNATRLMFAPTGRMLKAGEGYFSDYLLFFPGLAVGLTDRVTIGGGMSVFPGVDLAEQLFYFTPKVGIASGAGFDLAVGVLAIHAGFDEEDSSAGILYSVATKGGEHGGFTAGIGYGYAGGTLADRPALMFGGDRRLSRRFGVVTENYLLPGLADQPLLSLGGRFFGERLAVDFGFIGVVGESGLMPFVGFVSNFGRTGQRRAGGR